MVNKVLGVALVLPLFAGCEQEEPCTSNEGTLIQEARLWVGDHTKEIQEEMNLIFPDSTRTADEISEELSAAKIECAVFPKNPYALAQTGPFGEISINVELPFFSASADEFVQSGWYVDPYPNSADCSVITPGEGGETDISACVDYRSTLAHEAAHRSGLNGHTSEAGEIIGATDWDASLEQQYLYQAQADEVYAWGASAGLVALKEQE